MDFSPDTSKLRVDPMTGPAMAIYSVSVALGVLAFIIVGLRVFTRARSRMFGLDDGFMTAGMLLYIVEVVLSCLGARSGLGSYNNQLSATMHMISIMYLIIWMLVYITSLLMVKTSICLAMLRIAGVHQGLRIAVIVNLAVIVATFFTTFIGVLLLCRPVEAQWNTQLVVEGKAECASMDAMIGLSYTSTASTLATDLSCVILPGVIMWRTQMKLSTKLWVTLLLSFGSFAGITTMIRTPYIAYYHNPTENLPYYTGFIVLWSNIETAIGLIAGSIPSLRHLFLSAVSRTFKQQSTDKESQPPTDLVTIGRMPASGRGKSKKSWANATSVTMGTFHEVGEGDDRERLRDASVRNRSTSSHTGRDDRSEDAVEMVKITERKESA